MGHSLVTPSLEFCPYLHIMKFLSQALVFSTPERRKSVEGSVPILILRLGSCIQHLALASDTMALAITWQYLAASNTGNTASSWMVPCLATTVFLRKKGRRDLTGQLVLFTTDDFDFFRKQSKITDGEKDTAV